MKKSIILLFISLLLSPLCIKAHQPEFSTAGFFRLADSGREIYSMNPAWRFYKGNCVGAEAVNFNDRSWEVVSLPHGIEYLPTEASGCVNYQGEVWYRKHFTPDATLKGKKLFLHFEAIMGKSKIYVNGKLLSEHFGGYLPAVVDVTDALEFGKDNLIAVWADNSNDPNYPPENNRKCWISLISEEYTGTAGWWHIIRYSLPIRIMKTKKQAEDYLSLMTMYRISRPKYCSKYRFGTPEKSF